LAADGGCLIYDNQQLLGLMKEKGEEFEKHARLRRIVIYFMYMNKLQDNAYFTMPYAIHQFCFYQLCFMT